MKTFSVSVYEENGGYVQVKAPNAHAAERKARKILEEAGIEGFDVFNVTYRDVTVLGDTTEVLGT